MPLQRVDNSFDSNDSKMGKSVASENLQEKGNFSEVFESASSKIEKKQKNDVKQKLKPAVTNNEGIREGSKLSKKPLTHFNLKNEKLIGLKRIGPDLSKTKMGKIVKSKESIKKIINKVEISELKENQSEEISSDNFDESKVNHPEALEKLPDSIQISDSINFPAATSDAGAAEQMNNSLLLKSGSNEKKNFSDKKKIIKNDSKNSKGKISVLDLRQVELKNNRVKHANPGIESENKNFLSGTVDQINSDSSEESKPIVIELAHIKDNFSSESKTLTTSSSSSLMKQLEESVNSKIVKQSSIILKDGGSGEIKLILKPEQLGKVRIRLSLTDNRIAGQIIVDSAAVKEVFEQNLQNLERAFKENGFDTAALNVSVGGDQSGQHDREKSGNFAKKIELIDENIPTMISESENLIDLVV